MASSKVPISAIASTIAKPKLHPLRISIPKTLVKTHLHQFLKFISVMLPSPWPWGYRPSPWRLRMGSSNFGDSGKALGGGFVDLLDSRLPLLPAIPVRSLLCRSLVLFGSFVK
ncbi:hypothetical protein ACLB2K_064314 [Fragaria x ananassa]